MELGQETSGHRPPLPQGAWGGGRQRSKSFSCFLFRLTIRFATPPLGCDGGRQSARSLDGHRTGGTFESSYPNKNRNSKGPGPVVHLHLHTHFSFGIGVSRPEVLAAAAAAAGPRDARLHRYQRRLRRHRVPARLRRRRRPPDPRRPPRHRRRGNRRAGDERAGLGSAVPGDHRDSLAADRGCHAERSEGRRTAITFSPTSSPPTVKGCCSSLETLRFLERIVAASGPRDLYAELVPGKERHAVLAAARRLGLPTVATNAVVMAHPEDWSLHRLLRAIHLNTTISALEDGGTATRTAVATSRRPRRPPLSPRRLAPPDLRPRPPLPRLSRGGARDGRDRRAMRVPDSGRPSRRPAPRRRGRRAPAAPRPRVRGRASALRHHRAGDPGAPGARARHHRAEGLRRLLPRGARHRRPRTDPLRPRLRRQLDRELLSRHHPRRAARRRTAVRALPQSRAQGPARHRSRLPLGRARPRCWPTSSGTIPGPRPRWSRTTTASGCAARCARWPRCTAVPRARSARSPAGSPSSRTCRWRRRSRPIPTSASSICRRAGASSPAWRSRWWACRGISRCTRAAS